MIFVTVGSVMPFDRLVRSVDQWAERTPSMDVFAQIGEGTFVPQHCRYVRELAPKEYAEAFCSAELIVAHAGMGTIISAVEWSKPVILLPRLSRLNEHVNDHQLATLKRFAHLGMISAAETEQDLVGLLDDFVSDRTRFIGSKESLDSQPRSALVDFVRSFVQSQ